MPEMRRESASGGKRESGVIKSGMRTVNITEMFTRITMIVLWLPSPDQERKQKPHDTVLSTTAIKVCKKTEYKENTGQQQDTIKMYGELTLGVHQSLCTW